MTGVVSARHGRARHGRVVEPLSFRAQFFQDMTIAMGPVIVAGMVGGDLRDAGVISVSAERSTVWLAVVPFAVSYWHAARRPPVPPPAGAWRRVLTVAASALTLALAVSGTAGELLLVLGHRLSWLDFPGVPLVAASFPLMAARTAVRRWRAGPPAPAVPVSREG